MVPRLPLHGDEKSGLRFSAYKDSLAAPTTHLFTATAAKGLAKARGSILAVSDSTEEFWSYSHLSQDAGDGQVPTHDFLASCYLVLVSSLRPGFVSSLFLATGLVRYGLVVMNLKRRPEALSELSANAGDGGRLGAVSGCNAAPLNSVRATAWS